MSVPQSLPAWLYTDPRFFELEREKVFAQAWHIVGHINDIPSTGDYLTLDILGERFVTVRLFIRFIEMGFGLAKLISEHAKKPVENHISG